MSTRAAAGRNRPIYDPPGFRARLCLALHRVAGLDRVAWQAEAVDRSGWRAEAGRRLGVSRVAVWTWSREGGGVPCTAHLVEIARLAGVSLDWLLTGAGPGPATRETVHVHSAEVVS